MEANQYLEFLGYNTSEYQILSEEQVEPYYEYNHRNYVYAITDPRGKKLFGKNAKIVSIKWKNDIDSKISKTPSTPPAPPTPPSLKEIEIVAEEVVVEQPKELSNLLKSRIFRLQVLGWKDQKSESLLVNTDGGVMYYNYLEEMENDEWDKYLLAKKEPKQNDDMITEPIPKAVIEVESFDGKKETIDVIQNKEEDNLVVEQEKELKNLQESLREITASKKKLESNYNLLLEDNANQVETIVQLRDKVSNLRKSLGEEMNKPSNTNGIVAVNNVLQSNFFRQLEELSFDAITIGVTKLKDDKMSVVFRPINNSGDNALDNVKAISVSGTSKDLDNSLIEAVKKPIEVVYGLMTNAKEFIEETKKLEAQTKKKKAEQDKIKKLVEAAKKYHDKEDFDATKKANVSTATKKWNEILELDKDNKDALAGIKKLKEQTSNNENTLI